MKTKIIIVRHGQSIANVEHFFAGHVNSPLSDLGKQQAVLTSQYVFRNYKVDCVYASDLIRAYETGKLIADLYGLEVILDQRLREIFAGKWEGVPYELLMKQFSQSYQIWHTNIGAAVCDGGESVKKLQERVLRSLTDICESNPGKTVVIATHATPIRVLQCHCQGKALDQMKDIQWVSNASVSVFSYENGQFHEKDICYDAHLGQLISGLPKSC